MIAMTIAALFAVVAFSGGLSLLDSWIRGRLAYRTISRERALMSAGFVPVVEPGEMRLRNRTRIAPSAPRHLGQNTAMDGRAQLLAHARAAA